MQTEAALILLLDNHDSFSWNLAQALAMLGPRVEVRLSDAVTLAEVARLQPRCLVISPGPGRPRDAGISGQLVREYAGRLPILGVCLGHQVIAEVWGARLLHAPELVHGKARAVRHRARGLFAGLPQPLMAGRYHSLVVDPDSLPAELEPTAWSEDGLLMGLAHRELAVFGVQFHPESVLTPAGGALLANFLAQAGFQSARPKSSSSRSMSSSPK